MFDLNKLNDEELIVKSNSLLMGIRRVKDSDKTFTFSEYASCGIYVLYKMLNIKDITINRYDFMDAVVPPEYKDIINRMISDELFDYLLEQETTIDVLQVALFEIEKRANEIDKKMPNQIHKLTYKLFNIEDGKKIANFGCGVGEFLVKLYLKNEKNEYYGFDEKNSSIIVAKMKSEILGCNITYKHIGINDIPLKNKFDFIFVNDLSSFRFNFLENKKLLVRLNINDFDNNSSLKSSFALGLALSKMLEDDGKIAMLVPNYCLSIDRDKKIRDYYVEKGLVETVIALPEKVLDTALGASLIILSEGNESIRMVDATKIYKEGRRGNSLTDDNIEEILNSINTDGELSKMISPKELCENNYELSVNRYVKKNIVYHFSNTVKFEELLQDGKISRGASITAKELDEKESKELTNMQYLMINNIKNGVLEKKLKFLKESNDFLDKYRKCLVENFDLVMSRIASQEKIAVAEIDNNKKILATGNIFVIKLDREKVNPYYLKAFFDSSDGKDFLEKITTKATIPIIAQDDLLHAEIPLPSIKEQDEIAKKYIKTLERIQQLTKDLEEEKKKLQEVYTERN